MKARSEASDPMLPLGTNRCRKRNKFVRETAGQLEVSCHWCERSLFLFPSRIRQGERRFCDMDCRNAWHRTRVGVDAPHWRGGTVWAKGRAYVRSPQHPNADQRGYVLRSRLVMESVIGRHLFPEEEVHHVDENPSNDDPSNLALTANHEEHMRLYHGKHGRWSMNHDTCSVCGSVDRPHVGNGLCDRCSGRRRYRDRNGIAATSYRRRNGRVQP